MSEANILMRPDDVLPTEREGLYLGEEVFNGDYRKMRVWRDCHRTSVYF